MKLWLLLLVSGWIPAAEDSRLREIVKSSVENYQKDQMNSLRYEYLVDDDIKSKGVERIQVTTLSGTPYERIVARNGEPLDSTTERSEQRKFEKAKRERASEEPTQREERVRKWQQRTDFLKEAPDAFEFEMLPDTEIGGRAVYTIDCKPKPGYVPRQNHAVMFQRIQARLWVDKQDLRIVKVEADTLETVAIGWVLARIGKGAHIELEEERLDDGDWMLKKLVVIGRARVLLVDDKQLDETVTYSNFKLISGVARNFGLLRASNGR